MAYPIKRHSYLEDDDDDDELAPRGNDELDNDAWDDMDEDEENWWWLKLRRWSFYESAYGHQMGCPFYGRLGMPHYEPGYGHQIGWPDEPWTEQKGEPTMSDTENMLVAFEQSSTGKYIYGMGTNDHRVFLVNIFKEGWSAGIAHNEAHHVRQDELFTRAIAMLEAEKDALHAERAELQGHLADSRELVQLMEIQLATAQRAEPEWVDKLRAEVFHFAAENARRHAQLDNIEQLYVKALVAYREALAKYGKHTGEGERWNFDEYEELGVCAKIVASVDDRDPDTVECTCGFDAALARQATP